MDIRVFSDPESVAETAAEIIVDEARAAVSARGRFTLAVSGGQTPSRTLRALAAAEMPWEHVFVFQVDERVAPAGHPDRNFTQLRKHLLDHAPVPVNQVYPMPVELSDPDRAASAYILVLEQIAGTPATLDLVHLGLGPDGHTASLVPDDPVLDVADRDVAATGIYNGRRRLTLTYPILNRARRVLWVITGEEKMQVFSRLRDKDTSIPAARVNQDRAVALVDRAAMTLPGI